MAAARRWETLQVSLLLLVVLVIFFGKAIFTGQKLLPADIAYADPVCLGHAPTGFAQPHNILLYDQAYQFCPWRVYLAGAASGILAVLESLHLLRGAFDSCGSAGCFLSVEHPILRPFSSRCSAVHGLGTFVYRRPGDLLVCADHQRWQVRGAGQRHNFHFQRLYDCLAGSSAYQRGSMVARPVFDAGMALP